MQLPNENDIANYVHENNVCDPFFSLVLAVFRSFQEMSLHLDSFFFLLATVLSVQFHCPFKSFDDMRCAAMANYDPVNETYGNISSLSLIYPFRFVVRLAVDFGLNSIEQFYTHSCEENTFTNQIKSAG